MNCRSNSYQNSEERRRERERVRGGSVLRVYTVQNKEQKFGRKSLLLSFEFWHSVCDYLQEECLLLGVNDLPPHTFWYFAILPYITVLCEIDRTTAYLWFEITLLIRIVLFWFFMSDFLLSFYVHFLLFPIKVLHLTNYQIVWTITCLWFEIILLICDYVLSYFDSFRFIFSSSSLPLVYTWCCYNRQHYKLLLNFYF